MIDCFVAEAQWWHAVAFQGEAQEVFGEQRDIFGAGAQWWEVDFDDVESVV